MLGLRAPEGGPKFQEGSAWESRRSSEGRQVRSQRELTGKPRGARGVCQRPGGPLGLGGQKAATASAFAFARPRAASQGPPLTDASLPFRQGNRATSISNQYAVELAARNNVAIRSDERAQAPWFRYVDGNGREHEVWFEDARSIRAKLDLAREYGLYGVGYWNLMRPFPQNWLVLNALYNIRDTL